MPDPSVDADLIYLCSPNNPTGAVYRREQLAVWVAYALEHHAVILFDAAYEAFVDDPALPHSIYEIEGAKQCAIEFCSFSKTAGFTGTRCGYTVVPHELCADGISLSSFGCGGRRQNLTASLYIVQRGAEAVFTPEGQAQVREAIAYYRENASVISGHNGGIGRLFYRRKELTVYLVEMSGEMDSWAYFDYLLQEANIVRTPGVGFGANGEGFFRLTAFGDAEKTKEAMDRLKAL